MCDITPRRGFIVLLLGEAKSEPDVEFFSKGLQVVNEKLSRILSRTSRPIYLSFIPQDISRYRPDDPIALYWELILDKDECQSLLCEKLDKCEVNDYNDIPLLKLSEITGIFHGLLEKAIDCPGSNMLLDVIIMVSEPGVNQLSDGDEALELFGALRRARWQSGYVTAVYSLPVSQDLTIACAVNKTIVMTETEKFDCIDENVWWRGVYLPVFNPFDATNRDKLMVDLSIGVNYDFQDQNKNENKASKKQKRREDEYLKSEFHLLILVVKEIVNARFPVFILDPDYLNLYSSDERGAKALVDLTGRLTPLDAKGGTETAAVLALVPCCLEKTLSTDTWYEYIIGKQSHWINTIKVKLLHTPNYCVPFQTPNNGVWEIWKYKEKLDLPEQVLEEYLKSMRGNGGGGEKGKKGGEEEGNKGGVKEGQKEASEPMGDIYLPEFNVEHISIIHSVWNEMLKQIPQSESGELDEEYESKIDEILKPLHSFPKAPMVLIKPSSEPPPTPKFPEDWTDTDEYKALRALDEYYNWSKEDKESSTLKRLGGFSPPPMSHNKEKVGVDSLLDCFDQEGHPIGDLEPVSLPSNPKRKDIRTRLFENATETDERDKFFEYSWENPQKYRVKNETKGLMNYESPLKPKIYYTSSLYQGGSSSHSRSLEDQLSRSIEKCSLSKNNTKKLTPKNHLRTKTKSKSSKRSKDTKQKIKNSASEPIGDGQLRSLLERSVVKALKGEQLNRDHPQFKAAYTQLFNVCKCFLTGLELGAAIEKVEQLAITNAKQVIELQLKK